MSFASLRRARTKVLSSGTVGSPFDVFLVNGLMRAHGKPRLSPAKSCTIKLSQVQTAFDRLLEMARSINEDYGISSQQVDDTCNGPMSDLLRRLKELLGVAAMTERADASCNYLWSSQPETP